METYLFDFAQSLSKHLANFDTAWKERQCTELVEILISCQRDAVSGSPLSGNARARREKVEYYIEANIENPQLSPATIVDACGVSLSALHALFHAEGKTLMRHVLDKRLNLAAQRLRCATYQQMSIGDLAFECGFSDLSHFCRSFKVRFGHSPKMGRTS